MSEFPIAQSLQEGASRRQVAWTHVALLVDRSMRANVVFSKELLAQIDKGSKFLKRGGFLCISLPVVRILQFLALNPDRRSKLLPLGL